MRLQMLFGTTLLTLLALLVSSHAQSGGGYDLSWWTISSGGVTFGQDQSGNWIVGATVGQPTASDSLTSQGYDLRGGFWYPRSGCVPGDGDTDGSGCIDDADLLAVLFAFGNSGNDLGPVDTNCDGQVDDADLLTVLFNFGRGC